MAKKSAVSGVSYISQLIVIHEIVSAEVTLVNVADNEVLPTLLNPLRRRITQVSADGAYDTKACHNLLQRKGCKPTIPPRINAGYGGWTPENEAVKALKSNELSQWKRKNDYHQRSLSETAMYRYKQLVSPKLSLRDYNAQYVKPCRCKGNEQSHKTRIHFLGVAVFIVKI